MPRIVTASRPISAQQPITEFYRQEFVRHHRCLQQHRPYFSEGAIAALRERMSQLQQQLDRFHGKHKLAFEDLQRWLDNLRRRVEAVLARIMGELESMCSKDNVDELVSSLLKKIDGVTGLSAWSDHKHTH